MAGLKKMTKARKMMIYLDERDHEAVKKVAASSGISMAEFIRKAVQRELPRASPKARKEVQ